MAPCLLSGRRRVLEKVEKACYTTATIRPDPLHPRPSALAVMTSSLAPPLEKGDLLLVTGATGFIGAHVVEQALKAGLRVRAVARTEAKASVLTQYFAARYPGQWEVCIVPDMMAPNAYAAAMAGDVRGVAHIASVLTFSDEWDKVVPPSVQGALGILRAAAAAPSVQRVVLTSSSFAATYSHFEPDKAHDVTSDSWNEEVARRAKTNGNKKDIYAASKVLSEQAAWDFMRQESPHFTLTTICPNVNWGPTHPAAQSFNTSLVLYQAAAGDTSRLEFEGPQWMVNVMDTARVHVAALTRSDVGNERILAFTAPYTYASVVQSILAVRPEAADAAKGGALARVVSESASNPWWTTVDLNRVHNARFLDILGKDSVVDLPTSIRQTLETEPSGWKAL